MVNLVRWDPFKELEELTSSMQKSFDDAFLGGGRSLMSAPLMDVFEEDNKLVMQMQVGGLKENEIDISVSGGVLTIKGERHDSEEEKQKRNYILRETSTSIYRRMALPKRADADRVEADLKDGILRIEVPIKAEPKPKKVAIKTKGLASGTKK